MKIDSFGKKLEIYMAVNGINQVELAEKLGTDPGYISRVINEKITPRENTKEELVAVLGLTLDEFDSMSFECVKKGSIPCPDSLARFTEWCQRKGFMVERYFALAVWIVKHLTPQSLSSAMAAMDERQRVELSLNFKVMSEQK